MRTRLLDPSDANDRRIRRFNGLLVGATSLEDVLERLEKEETENDSWVTSLKKTDPSKILALISFLSFIVAFGSVIGLLVTGIETPEPLLASIFIYSFVIMLVFVNLAVVIEYLRISRI